MSDSNSNGKEDVMVAEEPASNGRETSDFSDKHELARMGKKQVLKRNFGFMSILGFSCTILITWEAVTVLFLQGLSNGGTAGVIYSYIVVWVGTCSLFATMCELASMAPTSGGQYHWVAMMAPRSSAKFLSYFTGMMTVAGWQATLASTALLVSNQILACASLNQPSFVPASWQGTLLLWAAVLFAVFINTQVSSTLPKFEGLILILHVVGFFAVMIPLVILGPHGDAKTVFTTFNNDGGFKTNGLSFMVGMMGNVFAFGGTDAAFHMAEETVNPAVVVPTSIMLSLVINGLAGFAILIAIIFCMGDIDEALASAPGALGFPYMYILQQATGSTAAAIVLTALIFILGACGIVGMMASTSRIFWSFSRDRGMPYWEVLSRVHPKTSVPIWAVAITTIIAVLLSLINIGSYTAFENVTSLSIMCLYTSYFIAGALLLYRRTTTGFAMPDSSAELPAMANTTGAKLVWGPFRIPGALGIANNIFALCYMVVIVFFSFWPANMNPTPAEMNWSVVVSGGVIIFSFIFYFVRGRKVYNGPIVETDIAL